MASYTIHDISLDSNTIGNIVSINFNPNGTVTPGFASGAVGPSTQYVSESTPSSTFQSTALEQILALNTGTMLQVGQCTTSATTTVPFAERVGCLSGSASHQSISSSNTYTYLTSIAGQLGQSATIDGEIKYLSTDGVTSPCTANSGASLSAAVHAEEYLLAMALIDGTEVPGLQGVTITPGFEIIEQREGTGIYPTDVFVKTIAPMIEITTNDLASAVAVVNAAALSSGVDVYFAKRTDGGVTVAYATEEHIKIAAVNGIKQMSTASTSRDDGSGTIKIDLRLPSSGAILVSTNDVAIPTE